MCSSHQLGDGSNYVNTKNILKTASFDCASLSLKHMCVITCSTVLESISYHKSKRLDGWESSKEARSTGNCSQHLSQSGVCRALLE